MNKKEKFEIVQFPNKYLWTMIITWPLATYAQGIIQASAKTVFIVAAIIWSYEEIINGVNWFRKLLGVVVMLIILMDIFRLILPL